MFHVKKVSGDKPVSKEISLKGILSFMQLLRKIHKLVQLEYT